MWVTFHPLPTSCTPPAAAGAGARSPASHPSRRMTLASPSFSSSHAKSIPFPLHSTYHPKPANPLLPASSQRLPANRHPGFSMKDYFLGGLCSCSSTCFSYGVPNEAMAWSRRAGVSPLRQQHSASLVAAAAAGRPSNSKKEDKLVTDGLITELLPNCMFRVRLDNGEVILGYVSGKMRTKMVRVLVGDRVKIEVSRYDSTRGRIVYRLRSKASTD